eukprot:2315740-Pleurochrysis_carterae.AAC.1
MTLRAYPEGVPCARARARVRAPARPRSSIAGCGAHALRRARVRRALRHKCAEQAAPGCAPRKKMETANPQSASLAAIGTATPSTVKATDGIPSEARIMCACRGKDKARVTAEHAVRCESLKRRPRGLPSQ